MIRDPAWRHDGDLIVSWNYCGAVMELVRNWQGASVVLLIHQFQATYMPAWMPSYCVPISAKIME